MNDGCVYGELIINRWTYKSEKMDGPMMGVEMTDEGTCG